MIGRQQRQRAAVQALPQGLLRCRVARGWAAAELGAFDARDVDVFGREQQIMGAGFTIHGRAQGLSGMDGLRASLGRNVHDQHWYFQNGRKADGALRGFAFRDGIVADSVVLGSGVAGRQQVARDPADYVIVFGVNHRQCAFAGSDGEYIQQLPVVQFQLVVGHEDLERGNAGADQFRKIAVQGLGRGIRDDQVIAIVDDGLLGGRGCVGVGHLAQGLAAVLRGEGHDGGIAAVGRGDRRAVPVVGTQHAHAGELFHMAMAVDSARHHQPAGCVNGAPACRKRCGNRGNHTVRNADVADEVGLGRYDAAIVQGQIEVCHGKSERMKKRAAARIAARPAEDASMHAYGEIRNHGAARRRTAEARPDFLLRH
ncbi:hypothetical protein FQZ97_545680 [compost metagenome]